MAELTLMQALKESLTPESVRARKLKRWEESGYGRSGGSASDRLLALRAEVAADRAVADDATPAASNDGRKTKGGKA